MRAVAGLGVLIILVIIAGVLASHLLLRKHPIKPVVKPRATKIPRFEIYPEKDVPPHKPIPKPVPAIPKELPKIAIIIDDLGYDREIVEKFLGLNAVFTFSILPYSPFQKSIARSVHSKGFDVMLHLPMEPNEYPMVNPGPGALLTSMSPDQLIKQLDKDLDSVPFIQWVNNHGIKNDYGFYPAIPNFFCSEKTKALFYRQPYHNRNIMQTLRSTITGSFCAKGCVP